MSETKEDMGNSNGCKTNQFDAYPPSWQPIKMKFFVSLKGRIGWEGLTSDEFIDSGPFLITGTDFVNGSIDYTRSYHVSEWRYNQSQDIQLKDGDLLITKDGTVGKTALVERLPGKATLNSGLMLIRPRDKSISNEYLQWVLSSSIFWNWFDYQNGGNSTITHLYQQDFGNFSFKVPSYEEQIKKANYLKEKIKEVDEAISQATALKEKLLEYRKSIIDEVVKGLE